MWYMLAREQGLPVSVCQKRYTHREFLDWCEFYSNEYDRPSRADLYAAQVAFYVYKTNSKRSVQFSKFLIELDRDLDKQQEIEDQIEQSQAYWKSKVGYKPH